MKPSRDEDVLSTSDLAILASYVTTRYWLTKVRAEREIAQDSSIQYVVVGMDEGKERVVITLEPATARRWVDRHLWADWLSL